MSFCYRRVNVKGMQPLLCQFMHIYAQVSDVRRGGAQTDQRFVSEARAAETMPVILMSDCAGLEPLKELCRCELGLRHNENMI